jgi:NAD-dependent deacetylase
LAQKSIDAHPNPAHISLAGLQTSGHIKTIITQNIDGLHQKAGSKDVIELHGNLDNLICPSCRRSFPLVDFRDSWLQEHKFPICRNCSALLKPDIVLYEEMLPEDAWKQAEFACNHAEVIFIAGTSLEVMPASSLPLGGVHRGAKLVIMNLSPTPLDSLAESVLPLDVAIGVPELARRITAI